MALIVTMRRQKCVWWDITGIDRYGNNVYAPAVELKCRWEDTNTEVVGPDGVKINSQHTVYPEVATKVGGVMKLCLLADLTNAEINSENPKRIEGAVSIKTFSDKPNLKNTRRLNVANL